jgi:hypothetical protein
MANFLLCLILQRFFLPVILCGCKSTISLMIGEFSKYKMYFRHRVPTSWNFIDLRDVSDRTTNCSCYATKQFKRIIGFLFLSLDCGVFTAFAMSNCFSKYLVFQRFDSSKQGFKRFLQFSVA